MQKISLSLNQKITVANHIVTAFLYLALFSACSLAWPIFVFGYGQVFGLIGAYCVFVLMLFRYKVMYKVARVMVSCIIKVDPNYNKNRSSTLGPAKSNIEKNRPDTILTAVYSLFFFQKYTRYSRWFEIACGILAWGNVALIIYTIIK